MVNLNSTSFGKVENRVEQSMETRLDRAIARVKSEGIQAHKLSENLYWVTASGKTPGVHRYYVRVMETGLIACECAAAQFGSVCDHYAAVVLARRGEIAVYDETEGAEDGELTPELFDDELSVTGSTPAQAPVTVANTTPPCGGSKPRWFQPQSVEMPITSALGEMFD